MSPEQSNPDIPPVKTGDHFFFELNNEPTPLELLIFEIFDQHKSVKFSSKSVFISLYSVYGYFDNFEFPHIELPDEALVCFFQSKDRGQFEFPHAILTYPQAALAGKVQLSSRKLNLEHHTLLLVAFDFSDDPARRNMNRFNLVGVISALIGQKFVPYSIFEGYFNLASKKVIYSPFQVKTGCDFCSISFDSYTSLYNKIDLSNKKIESCFWLLGKAFTSKAESEKVIFYHAALEVLTDCNQKNFFRKMYKKSKSDSDFAIKSIDSLSMLRNKLLHSGVFDGLEKYCERALHALVIDGVAFLSGNEIKKSFIARIYQSFDGRRPNCRLNIGS